jgi:hypothetical protein
VRPSQLRFRERWLIFAALVIGIDMAAIYWVVEARSDFIFGGGAGGVGPYYLFTMNYGMYDGSSVTTVHNYVTGKTTRTVTRRASTAGLCRVWWPAAVSRLLTLLALAVALTRAGQRFIATLPLPQMTTRRWMIAVAVLGTECGLVITTMRNSGVNPLRTQWVPILINLIGLHTLAFLPVGVALLYWSARHWHSRDDPETANEL